MISSTGGAGSRVWRVLPPLAKHAPDDHGLQSQQLPGNDGTPQWDLEAVRVRVT